MKFDKKIDMIVMVLAFIFVLLAVYTALIYTPVVDDSGWNAPNAQKIFYFHVPAAWVSFVAFGVVFVASILFLRNSSKKWDTIAFCSAEIGVVFCTLAIVTGPIWGKVEWGVYWRWDDTKLTITFVLWLIYVAYLVLRGGVESEEKSRLAAVFGIIGFVCVPLSFISILKTSNISA